MSKNVTLGYLGYKFQTELINQLLHVANKKFADRILDILHAKYFENEYFRLIIATVKDYYERFEKVPAWDTLETVLKMEVKDKVTIDYVFSITKEIRDLKVEDWEFVQREALNFCRQEELKRANEKVNKIIERGDFDSYEECAEIMKDALAVGAEKDDGTSISDEVEDVLQKDFRNPIPTGINGIDDLTDGGLSRGELGVILAPYGTGKAQPLTSKVLTPNGWVKMGDIGIGDTITSSDGGTQKVLGVYPQGKRPIYKVSFSDKTQTFCDGEHLWKVNNLNQRNYSKKRNKPVWDYYKIMKTTDMLDSIRVTKNNSLNYSIPQTPPVSMCNKIVPIDPYVLGVLLGDGCFTEGNQPRVFTNDVEIVEEIKNNYNGDINVITETATVKYRVSLLKLKSILSELGLYGCDSSTKFIPKDYLINDVSNREKLLQGLIDTDGSIDGSNVEYTTVSKIMAEQVRELVLSLGGRCNIKERIPYYTKESVKKYGKKCYRLHISFPDNGIKPAKLSRKMVNYKPRTKYINKLIDDIEFSHYEEAQCIYVSSEDHLYVTDDFILTHNTTILSKMANTAYNEGYNVLQIIFEDKEPVIKRKHYACWSGINLGDLDSDEFRGMVIETVKEKTQGKENDLIIKRFPSEGTTMNTIKSYLRHMISTGFHPDVIILDYIDVVESTKRYNDEWSGEGNVMRAFESMLSEYDIVGWTAVQGNRSSVSSELVTGDQMGGSIKKAQIGHFIMSIAKTLPQKEQGRATIAVLKSRFGKDGVVFENCIFDNGTVTIDTESSESFLGYEKKVEEAKEDKARERIRRARELRENRVQKSPEKDDN